MTDAPAAINPKALTTTIVVHALLLLLFAMWKYTVPDIPPQPQEMGMEVNLGTSDNGFGTSQPEDPDDPAESASKSTTRAASASLSSNMMEDDDEESPPVATSTRVRTTNVTNNTSTQRGTATTVTTGTRAQEQRPKFVMPGGQGRGGNGAMNAVPGGAEGNTFGNGDRGVRGGTPGAPNYTGTPGHGTGGIGFSLSGRNIVAYPARDAEFRQGGKVVVGITVNRSGTIVSSSVKSSTNVELNRIAIRKLQNVRFNKSDDAPQEQFGTITFVFKTLQ